MFRVEPHSRYTVTANEVPGLESTDISARFKSTNNVPIVADRSMYFRYRTGDGGEIVDGHASVGVKEPAKYWYAAEGLSSKDFDTWILVSNPNDKEVTANIDFMTEDGEVRSLTLTLPPMTRQTVNMKDAGLDDVQAGTFCASDDGIIMERATYFNYEGIRGDHESVGYPVQI